MTHLATYWTHVMISKFIKTNWEDSRATKTCLEQDQVVQERGKERKLKRERKKKKKNERKKKKRNHLALAMNSSENSIKTHVVSRTS